MAYGLQTDDEERDTPIASPIQDTSATGRALVYGARKKPAATAKQAEQGDFMRGMGVAVDQGKQAVYGVKAFIGDAIGSESIKESGLKDYNRIGEEIGARSKKSDSFSDAWASDDSGDLIDWLQYGTGYVLAQAGMALGTAAVGAVGGGAAAATGLGAGVVGALSKGGMQTGVKKVVGDMVRKKAATGMATEAAVAKTFRELGAGAALASFNLSQELGHIYGDAVEEAEKSGDDPNLLRVFGASVLAAGVETLADVVNLKGLGKAISGTSKSDAGLLQRVATEAFVGGLREGGTELVQTGIERWGASKSLTSPEAMKDYIDSTALGILGGAGFGTVKGAMTKPATEAPAPAPVTDTAPPPAEPGSTLGAGILVTPELREKYADDLAARGIVSDTPEADAAIKAMEAVERATGVIRARNAAEERAARQKEVEAAFGDTATSGVGVGVMDADTILQRAAVTPDNEQRTVTVNDPNARATLPSTNWYENSGQTEAVSGEDIVARQENWEAVPSFDIPANSGLPAGMVQESNGRPAVRNYFVSGNQANALVDYLTKTYEGVQARARKAKRSKAAGGGSYYFVEIRPDAGFQWPLKARITGAPSPKLGDDTDPNTIDAEAPSAPPTYGQRAMIPPPITRPAPAPQGTAPVTSPAPAAPTAPPAAPTEAPAAPAIDSDEAFVVGQRWAKPGEGAYVVQSVEPGGKRARVKFDTGQEATVDHRIERGNGYRLEAAKPAEAPAAPAPAPAAPAAAKPKTTRKRKVVEEQEDPPDVVWRRTLDSDRRALVSRAFPNLNKPGGGLTLYGENLARRSWENLGNGTQRRIANVMDGRSPDDNGTTAPAAAPTPAPAPAPKPAARKVSNEPPASPEQAAVAAARARLRTRSKNPDYLLDVVDEPSDPALLAAQEVAQRVFGRKVVFVKQAGDRLFNGMMLKDGTILLDVDTSKPALAVLGHELLHDMRRTNPALYDQFIRDLVANSRDLSSLRAELDAAYKAKGMKALSNDVFLEEFGADVVGDFFTDPKFWQGLAKRDQTLFQKVADFVLDFLKTLQDSMGVQAGFRPFRTDKLLVDVGKARKQVIAAIGEYAQSRGEQQAGEDRLSIAGDRETPRSTTHLFRMSPANARESLGLKPIPARGDGNNVRQIGEALNRDTEEQSGIISGHDTGYKVVHALAAAIADEVSYQLGTNSKTGTGLGWYSNNYPRAVTRLARRFPELATDPRARNIFTAFVAITSNGERVSVNIQNAIKLYQKFRMGQPLYKARVGSRRATALENNLVALDKLIQRLGIEGMQAHLLEELTVAEMNRYLRANGEKAETSYPADMVVPRAALYFGPKLGAFYANLSGSEGYLTMDLWWSRSINRMRGILVPRATDSLIQRLRMLLEQPGLTRDQVVAAALPLRDDYALYNFSTELEVITGKKEPQTKADVPAWLRKARAAAGASFDGMYQVHQAQKSANTITKVEFDMLQEAPLRATDREMQYAAARIAQAQLQRQGIDLTLADIQAALWYYEKRLYSMLSGRPAEDIGYEEAIIASSQVDRPERPSVRFDRGDAGRPDAGGAVREAVLDRAEDRLSIDRPTPFDVWSEQRQSRGQRGLYSARQGDGAGARVRGVSGRPLRTVGSFVPQDSEGLNGAGFATPVIHELSGAEAAEFRAAIQGSKVGNRFAASVYVYDEADYAGMRLFVADGAKTGFALKGDDVVSVFNYDPANKGAADSMLELAVQLGGRKLDAFDTVLPGIYSRHGFKAVARTAWNDDYAPDGWDKATYAAFNGGQPDVVFMAWDPSAAAYQPGDGQLFSSYDDAVAAQDSERLSIDRGESVKANPGVNLRRLAGLLGPQLYGDMKNMPQVAVKEMFQNAFDAAKGAIGKKPGEQARIAVAIDTNQGKIVVADNGTGMTTQILGGPFLQIAGTNKEGERSSGGFGIAKMQFLFGSKDLEVYTMRDGVLSVLKSTGASLMEAMDNPNARPDIQVYRGAEAMRMFQDKAAAAWRESGSYDDVILEARKMTSGTVVTVTVPESYEDPSTGKTEEIKTPWGMYNYKVLKESPLFEDIKVDVGFDGSSTYENELGQSFPADKYTRLFDVKFAWGSAEIYSSKDPIQVSPWGGTNASYLSNGLWQFSAELKSGDSLIPRKFFVNIESKVKPEQAGYPFQLNRQGLTDMASKDFIAVQNYLAMLYQRDTLGDSVKEVSNVAYIKPDGSTEAVKGLVAPKLESGISNAAVGKGKVEVKDGKLIVNGKTIPVLSAEDMKSSKIAIENYVVPEGTVDVTRPLTHDNLMIPADVLDLAAAARKFSSWSDTDKQEIAGMQRVLFGDWARQRFGKRFDEMNYKFADAFVRLRNLMIDLYEDDATATKWVENAKKSAVGVGYDQNYRGVNAVIPFRQMLINPAATVRTDPERGSMGMYVTMVHEMAHEQVRQHGVPFEAHMQLLLGDLMFDQEAAQVRADLRATFAEYQDIIPTLNKALLYAAENSLGQPAGRNLQSDSDLKRADAIVGRAGLDVGNDGGLGPIGERTAGVPGGTQPGAFDSGREQLDDGLPEEDRLSITRPGWDAATTAALNDPFTGPPAQTIRQRLAGLRPDFLRRLTSQLVDPFVGLKALSPQLYMRARLTNGTDGGLDALMQHGHVYSNGGALDVKPGTKGLVDALRPLGSEVEDFFRWVALNRAAGLKREDRENFFTDESIRLRDKLIAGSLPDGRSRNTVYRQALADMNALNRSVLDLALQNGLIDQAGHTRFTNDIWYVPFYRVAEEREGDLTAYGAAAGLSGQDFGKRLKGGTDRVDNLLQNLLRNWGSLLAASQRNGVARDTLEQATSMGVAKKVRQGTEGAINVMVGGRASAYTVQDLLLVDALLSINTSALNHPILKVFGAFKRWLTGAVTMDPAFKIRNLIRDSIQSISLAELPYNPITNVANGMRAMRTEAKASALAGGGLFHGHFVGEQGLADKIERLARTGVNRSTVLTDPKDVAAKVLEWYSERGDQLENANRMALYSSMIANGKTHLEAAFAARDLMDFSLQGRSTAVRMLAMTLPFFNARLQGLYKLGRDGVVPTVLTVMGRADEGERAKAARFATMAGAVTLAGLLLYLAYKDDEEFQKREGWDRDGFWWFRVGDVGYRIPKPFELGSIGTIAERALEQLVDENVGGEVFAKSMKDMLVNTFAFDPIPQAVRPLLNLNANRDSFTGRPIESAGMQNLSKVERWGVGTTETAKALSEANAAAAEMLGPLGKDKILSPAQIDYLARGYFGWLGSTVMQSTGQLMRWGDGITYPTSRLEDYPVVGAFARELPSAQSRYLTEFYDSANKIRQQYQDIKHYQRLGQLDEAVKLAGERREAVALNPIYTRASKEISNLNAQMRRVEVDPDMGGDEKRQLLNLMSDRKAEIAARVEAMRRDMRARLAE